MGRGLVSGLVFDIHESFVDEADAIGRPGILQEVLQNDSTAVRFPCKPGQDGFRKGRSVQGATLPCTTCGHNA